MAIKGKPELNKFTVPPDVENFAKAAGTLEPPAAVEREDEAEHQETAKSRTRRTTAKLVANEGRAELKRQIPLRLTDEVIGRLVTTAAKLTIETGKRVSQQQLIETAILDWLKKHG